MLEKMTMFQILSTCCVVITTDLSFSEGDHAYYYSKLNGHTFNACQRDMMTAARYLNCKLSYNL